MLLRVAGIAAVVLAAAHTAFLIARADLRDALLLSLVSVALLAIGGALCLAQNRWSVPVLGASLLAVVPMPVFGAEIDMLYVLGIVLITALAMVAMVRTRRT